MRDIEVGARVSHYRLERQLGAGGMGAVFLAQDLTLNRPVAIKFLTAPDDDHSRRRLLREAQAAAALDHEGIAAVYEVGSDPIGGDFIVMQYVEGETLGARLQRGRLTAAEALAIGGRVAEALVAAHRRGIIHRDLKPHNIVITPSGLPKLLDFGLARRLMSAPQAAESETVSQLTQKDAVVGTPSYMAPEQARSQPSDARSDVFALGCVLYECLTGQRAFSGATTADVLGRVLHVDPPAVSSIVPELGPSYDALCARLLKKSADERFQSAEEVLGAIHALADTTKLTLDQSARRQTTDPQVTSAWAVLSPRARTTARIGAAILVIGGAAAAWQWYQGGALPKAPAPAVRFYTMGVEALRDGTYAGARDKFNEAISIFPNYVQAYSGLAQAYKELDDANSAQKALLRVDQMVPDRSRLPVDDQLQIEALHASMQRDHDQAIVAYRQLAAHHPEEPGAWLDLGRAEEAADRRNDARTDYEKALALDSHSAAAHVRLGNLRVKAGQRTEALASFDEAIRLYHAGGNFEGEAEALVRKGVALVNANDQPAAREALDRAVQMAGTLYLSQRVRAQFELARLAVLAGSPDGIANVEAVTEASVREATEKGLYGLAASGLIDLASVLASKNQSDRADAEFVRAIQIAGDRGATQTEMRARLQRASWQQYFGKPPMDVIALAAPALKFFSKDRYLRQEADAKNVMSRAYQELEQYGEASRLAGEALQFADSVGEEGVAGDSLQSLAPQLENLGRLPEALAGYQRIDQIYRRQKRLSFLPPVLLSQAEMLIVLGRGAEAEPFFAEVERGISAGTDKEAKRPRRVARLRALHALTEGRFADAARHAAGAGVGPGGKPDSTSLFAKVLAEYARAALGQSRTPATVVARWLDETSSPPLRRELSYWVAATLRARHQNALAYTVAEAAWSAPAGQANLELRWRLAAVATLAAGGAAPPDGATIPARAAEDDALKLKAQWGGYDATAYFTRADLKSLPGKVIR